MDFVGFMNARAKEIDNGIHNPRPIAEPRLRRIAAGSAARRDPSDPFIFGRAYATMSVGILHPDDFLQGNQRVSV